MGPKAFGTFQCPPVTHSEAHLQLAWPFRSTHFFQKGSTQNIIALPPSPNSHSQKVRLIVEDSVPEVSSRTAGQPVHVDSEWHLSAGHMSTHPSLPLFTASAWIVSLMISSRVPSITTCAGHVSTSLWCGSMLLSCSPRNCYHPNTVICYINQLLTWASGRSWNMGSTAMLHSTCEQVRG